MADLQAITLNELLSDAIKAKTDYAYAHWEGDDIKNEAYLFLLIGDLAHQKLGILLQEEAKVADTEVKPKNTQLLQMDGQTKLTDVFIWLAESQLPWAFGPIKLNDSDISLVLFRGQKRCACLRANCKADFGIEL